MARGISWNSTSLPVTDASLSFTREPSREQSMSGLGGEKLYGGLYGMGQGSFTAAYRPTVFNTHLSLITSVSPAAYTAIVSDDNNNCLTGTDCYFTSAEITLKAGELAKISMGFAARKITAAGSVSASTLYSDSIPVFYNSACDWGSVSAITIKIDRPYTADDYHIGDSTADGFYSDSIYQSSETTVTGTLTLSQTKNFASLADPGTLTFTFGSSTITITNAVLSGAELSASGRGLVNKTFSWAAPSNEVTFT